MSIENKVEEFEKKKVEKKARRICNHYFERRTRYIVAIITFLMGTVFLLTCIVLFVNKSDNDSTYELNQKLKVEQELTSQYEYKIAVLEDENTRLSEELDPLTSGSSLLNDMGQQVKTDDLKTRNISILQEVQTCLLESKKNFVESEFVDTSDESSSGGFVPYFTSESIKSITMSKLKVPSILSTAYSASDLLSSQNPPEKILTVLIRDTILYSNVLDQLSSKSTFTEKDLAVAYSSTNALCYLYKNIAEVSKNTINPSDSELADINAKITSLYQEYTCNNDKIKLIEKAGIN